LKFVVEDTKDFVEIGMLIDQLGNVDPARVLIMAQGTRKKQLADRARWIVAECLCRGYAFTPRLQIELFGNRRGT
jgi:7-carboxy-7-deazaguanine synthase